MKKSILLISLAVLPFIGYSQNVLPDWALGGFVRPEKANPIITPDPSSKFDCPMQGKTIGWEAMFLTRQQLSKGIKSVFFTVQKTIQLQGLGNGLHVSDWQNRKMASMCNAEVLL